MSNLKYLISLDQQWLLAINGRHSPWVDQLMWWVSQSVTWLPLYALLLFLLWWWYKGKTIQVGRWQIQVLLLIVMMFAVAVGGADLLCARVIKPLVARPRPTHDAAIGALVHVVNDYRGGRFGFCSNHAANTMAVALLFSLLMPKQQTIKYITAVTLIMLWVALNCYSRMYLGVHYPLDILAGLIVGTLTALSVGVPFVRKSER